MNTEKIIIRHNDRPDVLSYNPEIKEYYSLSDLLPIVDLKYRQLLKRVKLVSDKYKNNKSKISKKSNTWLIHYSIVNEFYKVKKPIPYTWFVTLASYYSFTHDYWKQIMYELFEKIIFIEPDARVKYVIEQTKRKVKHLHFITSFQSKSVLRKMIDDNYLTNSINGVNVKIKPVWEVKGLHNYFKKTDKPVLFKKAS